ncbi:MAG: sodium:solute symporter family protein [Mailhella sp.]|nr:sodium:solute symporter family protein [Mailhella sp.]
MLFFCVYAFFLLALGVWEVRRSRGAESFFLNGRRSGTVQVCFSLMGAAVGASATVGMAGLAWQVGFPAFWWIGAGALGFAFIALFLARSVHASGAWTMPEFIEQSLGRPSRVLASCIIVPSWVLVLAAQFIAMGSLTAVLTGLGPAEALAAGATVLILYSALGGQASVVRSDLPQGLLLLLGLSVGALCLYGLHPEPLHELELELVNETFGPERVFSFLLVMGGSYVAGPTMFSVLLSARDARAARNGAALASAALFVMAALVTALGVLCRASVPAGTAPDDVLAAAIGQMPPWAGMAMLVALFSAMLSSADSCLVTASTVLCNDLFRRRSALLCRVSAFILGAAGWLMAAQGLGILALMLAACDVCMGGLLGPVLASRVIEVLGQGRKKEAMPGGFRPSFLTEDRLCALAVASGACCGLVSSISGQIFFSVTGVVLSFFLTLWAKR